MQPTNNESNKETSKISKALIVSIIIASALIVLGIFVYIKSGITQNNISNNKGNSNSTKTIQYEDSTVFTKHDNIVTKTGNITVSVLETMSDTNSTIIKLKIDDPKSNKVKIGLNDIKIESSYEFPTIATYEGTTNDESVIGIKLGGGPQKAETIKMLISKINNVPGNWSLDIPINPTVNKNSAKLNAKFEFKNNTILTVNNIEFTANQTKITGIINKYIEGSDASNISEVSLYIDGKQIKATSVEQNVKTFEIYAPAVNRSDKIDIEITASYKKPEKIKKTLLLEK